MEFPKVPFAEISTGNVTIEDAQILGEIEEPGRSQEDPPATRCVIAVYPEGWFMWVPCNGSHNDREFETDWVPYWKGRGLSDAFVNLMRELRRQNIHYVRFDRDCDLVEGAPEFDW